MNEDTQKKQDDIIREIRKARGETTDLLELAVGASDQWPTYRARILRIFGDRGLEGCIQSILKTIPNHNVSDRGA